MRILVRLTALILFVALIANMPCLVVSANKGQDLDHYDVYRKNENQYMKIALTFDDGPHPKLTPRILDVLDKFNVKATFFTVGVNVHYYQDVFEDIVLRGHEIGNHTYTHPHVSRIDTNTLRSEVEECEKEIYEHGEYMTKLFRPPEGMIDNGVTALLHELDYKVILWDIDTRDWDHTTPENIAKMVIEKASSGNIILMHDYISYNSPTVRALELFLPVLIEKGYRFVTVSELIGSK